MTSTALTKSAPTDLASLAQQIQDEHLMCEQAAGSAVEHAIKAGELLIEAKAQVEHGGWGAWLGEHFPASDRLAQSYMQLAANPQRSAGFDSVNSALAELAEPREATESDSPAELVEGELVEEQPAPGPIGPRKQKQQDRLVESVVERVEGVRMTLGEVDLSVLQQAIPKEKGHQWAQQLRTGRTALSRLIAVLE